MHVIGLRSDWMRETRNCSFGARLHGCRGYIHVHEQCPLGFCLRNSCGEQMGVACAALP